MARIAEGMVNGETVCDADALVRLFLNSTDPYEADRFIEALLTQFAQPQIRRIARRKLSFLGGSEYQDVEDLTAEVVSELLRRLRELKDARDVDTIKSFSAYTAAATYRAYNDYLRRKYPQRHQLKSQLRHVLNTNPRFALWETQGSGWLCGPRDRMGEDARPLPEKTDLPDKLMLASPTDLLAGLFDLVGGPMEFDELVTIVVEFKGLKDWHGDAPDIDDLPATGSATKTLEQLENQQWIARLWTEIRELPLPQRQALLLNLRTEDGDSALALVPITGVATIRQIAGLLEMAVQKLAGIWNELPIDDMAISAQLGLTRQQVINLRKSARERLARRMATFGSR